jgi:subtilisin family serine protease
MISFKKHFNLLLAFVFALSFSSFAQSDSAFADTSKKVAPNNWYQLDRAETGYYGISLDKAYDFLKNRKSQTVVVGVIDSGVDTTHEDLKPVLWRNPGEIAGNKKDDDKNGYADDVYGWNFIGGKDGRNVHQDSYEAARVYWKLKSSFADNADTTKMNAKQLASYHIFLKAKESVTSSVNPAEMMMMQRILPVLERGDSVIAKDLGKAEYNGNDLKSYSPANADAKTATAIILNISKLNDSYDITSQQILDDLKGQVRKGEASTTPPEDFRGEIVKDNPDDINDRYYGNADVMAGTPSHGTHCSGIIAAARNNSVGMDGIADNVRIMMVRAVPDGDEHDKDIANAIRYAVDNGAKVISMSFGKSFSPEKNWVDDAVKYAESKDVLLVHAAGNDAKNIDTAENYPNPVFLDNSGKAKNFITVGASGDPTNGGFTASFSNYGKNQVDVFAPGVNIYSTLPGGNKYGNFSGTSMAAPVVAGIAALIREYFPDLTAEQVKYVIEQSVTPIKEKVKLPGTDQMVYLSDISKSGGEVNAYNAVKLAATLKGEKNPVMEKLPKSKVHRNAKD